MKYKCVCRMFLNANYGNRTILAEHPFSRKWCLYEVQMRSRFFEKWKMHINKRLAG